MKKKRSKQRKPSKTSPHEPSVANAARATSHRNLLIALAAVAVIGGLGWWGLSPAGFFGQRETASGSREELAPAGPVPKQPVVAQPIMKILCPFEGSVFPSDIAPTRFVWEDDTPGVDRWTVEIQFAGDAPPLQFASDTREWTPSADAWDQIKQRSVDAAATITICGVNQSQLGEILSQDRVSFGTSSDAVGAPIFYREVNLPFREAVKDPSAHIRWRFGSISNSEQPPVILDKMPLCGNCHSFSSDATTLGMDVDYGSDKGSYVLCPVSQEMTFDQSKIITWSDYKRDDKRGTLGLLSQVSPDGRYAISTVKDKSVFVAVDNLAFSQLFFPIQGILAYYDRQDEAFHALPGADDQRYVQSNPTWSPDGKTIVFARSEAGELNVAREDQRALIRAEDVPDFLDGKKTFRYDLWRIPFNQGKGGKPEPLLGASDNGKSNYFPKYSPDGKWIVFCQANSFMLLQQDSELYIVPAEGGQARRLRCNTDRMNSWHSWSPNGKWMVFSSKAYSLYTQLFLTHMDEQGRSTPPVVLSHFTSSDMAANIPEFVNASPDAIQRIRQEFIDDVSYLQAGKINVHEGDFDLAVAAFQKSLAINPENTEARMALAGALLGQGESEAAREQVTQVLSSDPENKEAHWLLGTVLEKEGKFSEAMSTYRQALQIDPDDAQSHQSIGALLLRSGSRDEGRKHLLQATQLDPENTSSYLVLGNSYLQEQKQKQACAMYRLALERDPDFTGALVSLSMALMQDQNRQPDDVQQALVSITKACQLTDNRDPLPLIIQSEALAASGRMAEATTSARKAMIAAQQMGNSRLAAMAGDLLQQFEQQMFPPRTP